MNIWRKWASDQADSAYRAASGALSYAMAISALALGLSASYAPVAALFASVAAGAFLVYRLRILAVIVVLGMVAGFALGLPPSIPQWFFLALMAGATVLPFRFITPLLRVSRRVWALCMIVASLSFCTIVLEPGTHGAIVASITGSMAAAYLGLGLARHLSMADARILSWGEDGLVAVTRDLLLGRITSGMLHDLAQPLNVISMANGNLGYIIEDLDLDEQQRAQLLERIIRISEQTESAAVILSLFRWFGREGNLEQSQLNVRSALDRALAVTRSNVRHHGVEVDISGSALEYLLPDHHGKLEMIAVAALLSSFGGFYGADGRGVQGRVLIHAQPSPAHIVIRVECRNMAGEALTPKRIDQATLWLVEQVARETGGDFHCAWQGSQPSHYVIRLKRDDV